MSSFRNESLKQCCHSLSIILLLHAYFSEHLTTTTHTHWAFYLSVLHLKLIPLLYFGELCYYQCLSRSIAVFWMCISIFRVFNDKYFGNKTTWIFDSYGVRLTLRAMEFFCSKGLWTIRCGTVPFRLFAPVFNMAEERNDWNDKNFYMKI